MTNLRLVDGPDSRTLGVSEWGDLDGRPVFFLHGTPGSRLRRPAEDGVRAAGLRLITYDRPGYGASQRHRGRRVVDCVADVAAIADDLGLDRFHVSGGSGGGPHALAVGARLPERVLGVEAVVCPAPRDRLDVEWTEGMDPENVKEFGWAMAGEETLAREVSVWAEEMVARFDAGSDDGLGEFDLDEADRAVLARTEVKKAFAEALREAFRPGVDGWVDDDLALLEPWGFELEEITVPVTLRYGARDVLVPAAHGEWLSRHLPGVRTIVDHSGGHMVPPEEQIARLLELVNG